MGNVKTAEQKATCEVVQAFDPRLDLAVERTSLSLERTQLAWVRTVIGFITAGLAIDKGTQRCTKPVLCLERLGQRTVILRECCSPPFQPS